jgi:Asp/Glu/hydantoin racemase
MTGLRAHPRRPQARPDSGYQQKGKQMTKVAVLHTSLVFISVDPVITDLLKEELSGAEVAHFVDSDVLSTVIREGSVSEASASRMIHLAKAAEAAGADVILSACSSLGPAVDLAAAQVGVPIVKIDSAMAAAAARAGDRIGVLATVPTTLGPTAELVRQKGTEAGRDVSIETRLAEGAFDALMSGDRAGHDETVLAAARDLATRVDVIVLAQASMWRMTEALEAATGKPVLSSPRLGVEDVAQKISSLAGH